MGGFRHASISPQQTIARRRKRRYVLPINHDAPAARPIERCPNFPKSRPSAAALQPVMEGSRFVKAEVRRKDLRFPLQKDFVARLEGQTVTGLGRRAKYLLADLASGDVLLMHLGMSGSFRVRQASNGDEGAGHVPSSAIAARRRMTMSCFTCRRARSSISTIRAASAT